MPNVYLSGKADSGYINVHEYVDLGLPSGLKCATCNVGATSPEQYGNYYVWGEISIKSEYSEENYTIKYKRTSDMSGNSIFDTAGVNWGGGWRMPTKEEFEGLLNNCKWEWVSYN